MLHQFRCLIGYQGLNGFIESNNQLFALILPDVIDNKIINNLINRKIIQINPFTKYFISFLLGLMPKHNDGLCKIYYLLYLLSFLVNDYIAKKFSMLFYSSLQSFFAIIINAEKLTVLIKQDIKNVFNILVILYI